MVEIFYFDTIADRIDIPLGFIFHKFFIEFTARCETNTANDAVSRKQLFFTVRQCRYGSLIGNLCGGGVTDQGNTGLLQLRKQGVVAVEMETSLIYYLANRSGAEAASFLLVSDIVGGGEEFTTFVTDEDLKKGMNTHFLEDWLLNRV